MKLKRNKLEKRILNSIKYIYKYYIFNIKPKKYKFNIKKIKKAKNRLNKKRNLTHRYALARDQTGI